MGFDLPVVATDRNLVQETLELGVNGLYDDNLDSMLPPIDLFADSKSKESADVAAQAYDAWTGRLWEVSKERGYSFWEPVVSKRTTQNSKGSTPSKGTTPTPTPTPTATPT